MARNRSSVAGTLKQLKRKREEDEKPVSSYDTASKPSKKSKLDQIVEAQTIKRTQGISGKDPKTRRMIPVIGADSPADADRFIRENPKDFVKMSPGIVEARKSNPRFDPDTGKPKKFMDTAQGRQFFTPTDKNAEGAKFVKEFGTYGLLSDPAEIPEEGVRDIRPKFTDPKTGNTVFTNPRAKDHRNFAAELRQKAAGNPNYWNDPANAKELAEMLNKGPNLGLTSSQIMNFIRKDQQKETTIKDQNEGRSMVEGIVRTPSPFSLTGARDPADIAFARDRAYPNQGKNNKFLKRFRKQMGSENKGRGKGGKGDRGQTGAIEDLFKKLPPELQEELVKSNPAFSSLLPGIIR